MNYVLDAPERPDSDYIRRMFDGLAARYDIFSWLIGLGQTHKLRRHVVEAVRPGMRVLDVGCGTGDLALACLAAAGPSGEVVGLDFSPAMLEVAARRLERAGGDPKGRAEWVCRAAEELPLEGRRFDLVVSGFVLRNLYENIGKILAGVHESLEYGGEVRFIDIAEPRHPVLRAVYRFYFFFFVGLYGLVLFGRKYPVPYLPQSSSRFLKTDGFVAALKEAGFRDVKVRLFMLGSVVLYSARK